MLRISAGRKVSPSVGVIDSQSVKGTLRSQNRGIDGEKKVKDHSLRRYYDGGSPSDLWAVRSAGIDPITGRDIFIKRDGTQTSVYDYDDEVMIGNSGPKLEGVIGTSLFYRGFSAYFHFRYRIGGKIFLNTLYGRVENISKDGLQYNQDWRALHDRWKKPGDETKYKGISLTDTTAMTATGNCTSKTWMTRSR